MQTIRDIMTPNAASITSQETIQRAAQMMDELNVGALPVCDDGRLVGMITDRDITVRATSIGQAPTAVSVAEVMSTDVRTCNATQSVEDAMQQMRDTQIRRVPVVDDKQKLIGIVSLGDLATKQAQEVDGTLEDISTPSEPDRG